MKENAVTGSVVQGAGIGAGRNEVENTLETRAVGKTGEGAAAFEQTIGVTGGVRSRHGKEIQEKVVGSECIRKSVLTSG